MDIEAAFELAKRSIVKQTGKPLIDSQKAVLQGIIEGKKLREITEVHRYNDSYVKQISSHLCQSLSDAFGEKVNKDNIRSVLEQHLHLEQRNSEPTIIPEREIIPAPVVLNSNFVGREGNFGVKLGRLKPQRRLKRQLQTKRVGVLIDNLEPALYGQGRNSDTLINDLEGYTSCLSDWDYAPHVEPFYGRQAELEQLKGWIADEDQSRRSCLVVLYGMGGIGKTYLAIKAGKQLEKEFNFLIFRSVRNTRSLSKLIASIEDIINPGHIPTAKLSTEESITKLINSLKKRRCLIILDDLESIFDPNNVAGRYLPEYEQYAEFVQRIATENHESSVLIVSREKITDIAALEGNRVNTLQVSGSEEIAQQILESQGFEYNNDWKQIATNYGANPLALKVMITMIQDLYGGQPEDFLGDNRTTSSFFAFHGLLDEQFSRLSPQEKELMFVLAILQKASIAQIFNDNWLDLPQSELIEYMGSLRRRSLLERNKSEFSLQPMVWRHTVKKLIDEIEAEMINFLEDEEQSLENLDILTSYPWQQEKEDNQRLLSLILRHFRASPTGRRILSDTLQILEEKYPEESGYAIDNLKALLDMPKLEFDVQRKSLIHSSSKWI